MKVESRPFDISQNSENSAYDTGTHSAVGIYKRFPGIDSNRDIISRGVFQRTSSGSRFNKLKRNREALAGGR